MLEPEPADYCLGNGCNPVDELGNSSVDGYEGGILRGHIAAGAAMGVPVGSKDISKLGI